MEKEFTDKGFSLIELVVVISVLAILSSIAIPSITGIINDAKVSAAKASIINILKECIIAGEMLERPPIFEDIAAWKTVNSYGDTPGLKFGFTYDTSLNSNTPIRGTDTCYRISSKSNTKDVNGIRVGILPHFEIFYDIQSSMTLKNCSVEGLETINKNYCDPSAPEGSQW